MQAESMQNLALPHDTVVIRLQSRDRCPSIWRQPDHKTKVTAPGEMLLPYVPTRVEQTRHFSGRGVESFRSVLLALVTTAACKREIR